MDDLRQLTAERPGDPLLHLLVRPVVRAADDVRDLEIEIVDHGRELVRGRPVRPGEGRPGEPDRPVRVPIAPFPSASPAASAWRSTRRSG